MVLKYDLDKIKSFLTDFHNMTGLTVSFWDAEMNQLAFMPRKMPAYCQLIKQVPSGKKACLTCDKKLIVECNRQLKPITAKCHAGLVDTAMPIMYQDKPLGFILFGQIKDGSITREESQTLLRELSKKLNLSEEKLTEAYQSAKKLLPQAIESTANILHYATLQLLISKTIDMGDHTFINQIDEYLKQNLENPLSVSEICEEFGISKNRLYALWKKHFNVTVAEYILNLRLEKAKHLLTDTDLRVHTICSMVGIPDYNYFSKLFKKHCGYSCRDYRKQFPLILK
ncbi:MAG: PocR ligand-binding domain-containing protein [Clostridia bacterium]|nr:PocR ligand-binding domain-containing protein [Clostridia bacterium]